MREERDYDGRGEIITIDCIAWKEFQSMSLFPLIHFGWERTALNIEERAFSFVFSSGPERCTISKSIVFNRRGRQAGPSDTVFLGSLCLWTCCCTFFSVKWARRKIRRGDWKHDFCSSSLETKAIWGQNQVLWLLNGSAFLLVNRCCQQWSGH